MNAPVILKPAFPLSLQNAPSLIERLWPAQKISVEAQKERKAVHGQTLTGLGSYWKGRKPLVLVRACVLGALLPSTGDDEADLAVFETLMGMADDQIIDRFKERISVEEIKKYGTSFQQAALLQAEGESYSLKVQPKEVREKLMAGVMARMPYDVRVQKLLRPEQVAELSLTGSRMNHVNAHLGTNARDIQELVQELGYRRFGRSPKVMDTFSGGGSIPFEAARLGCTVFASDLNPVACMLTWSALGLLGGKTDVQLEANIEQQKLAQKVDNEIKDLNIEFDTEGNRAKVYLYCLETNCPITGWNVPLSPSWVISETRKVIAKLVPDPKLKRFDLEIVIGASSEDLAAAAKGTVQDKKLVYKLGDEIHSIPIKTLRGDRRRSEAGKINDLRLWTKDDITPRPDDVIRERLYCIQWMTRDTLHSSRPATFFAAPTAEDMEREDRVANIVRKNLAEWQADGLVSDMEIETGKENEGPIRTNGWKFWHQMFVPRAVLTAALIAKNSKQLPHAALSLFKYLDNNSKACRWAVSQSGGDGGAKSTFDNQALKTIFNWATRSTTITPWNLDDFDGNEITSDWQVRCADARTVDECLDLAITDPPYADAVNYHEITEFFIAWMRKKPPAVFADWIWDSRRPLAIKGDGEDFRKGMVDAYGNMAAHMSEGGLQIVMFTHQDAEVWADMAQIFWGAKLRVMAAWYIATETTSELKKGGYVQGTVILVLRKLGNAEVGFKDEIVQEVKIEVAEQIDTMSGLNQNLKGHGRVENLFEDADLQMAGYAAALRVLTRYSVIDGTDMTKEALRPRSKMEHSLVSEIIDFAVQVANEHMVPEGMSADVWERLAGAERFFYRMMDVETTGARKLDNYQNFAKAFRVSDYATLMSNVEASKACLKAARQFKKGGFAGSEFAGSKTRALLYAIWQIETDIDGDQVISDLRELVPNYLSARGDILALCRFIYIKRAGVDELESRSASILEGLIRHERL
ncbi:DNA methylase [Streptomyces purpurogeneiscleroticus]|nr:DNA methylase [Streptomyces purpurogeneiscleroticus]